jgi:hypothetical protein
MGNIFVIASRTFEHIDWLNGSTHRGVKQKNEPEKRNKAGRVIHDKRAIS